MLTLQLNGDVLKIELFSQHVFQFVHNALRIIEHLVGKNDVCAQGGVARPNGPHMQIMNTAYPVYGLHGCGHLGNRQISRNAFQRIHPGPPGEVDDSAAELVVRKNVGMPSSGAHTDGVVDLERDCAFAPD